MCGAGETCVDGACVDVCQPAVCPGGAECTNGMCGEPTGTGGSSGAGGARGGSGGAVIQGGNGGVTGNGANAGVIVSGNSGAGGGQGDDDELGSSPKGDPGCACRAVPSRPGYLSFAGIGLGLLLFARRRARGRRAL
jgi:hypothetical protein